MRECLLNYFLVGFCLFYSSYHNFCLLLQLISNHLWSPGTSTVRVDDYLLNFVYFQIVSFRYFAACVHLRSCLSLLSVFLCSLLSMYQYFNILTQMIYVWVQSSVETHVIKFCDERFANLFEIFFRWAILQCLLFVCALITCFLLTASGPPHLHGFMSPNKIPITNYTIDYFFGEASWKSLEVVHGSTRWALYFQIIDWNTS